MTEIVLTTLDWVPELPRGYVRDLRIRWALEEAGLPYRVETTPFPEKTPAHYAAQPFGQVPFMRDGDITIFETGAMLLHLGEMSDQLLPADAHARADAKTWLFAALNSVEMAVLPWSLLHFSKEDQSSPAFKLLDGFVQQHRLKHLEPVLTGRDWLAGVFSIADIAMSDVLRLADRFDGLANYPATRAYVARCTARPAFQKAHADQLAHFAAADAARA